MFKIFKRISRGLLAISLSVLMLASVGYGIAQSWRGFIDIALGTASSVTTSEAPEGVEPNFKSDYANTTDLIKEHMRLGEVMSEEGSVLLKNQSGLPLASGAKVTLFGMGSQFPFQGGSMGSSNANNTNKTTGTYYRDLVTALTEKDFKVNPVMTNIYTELGKTAANKPGTLPRSFGVGDAMGKFAITEPDPNVYAETTVGYASSFTEYKDAAIVVFTRPSSEAGDFYPGATGVDQDKYGTKNSLGLSINEKAVLKLATDNFSKVIVLLNSNSTLEIEDLKTNSKVQAILWVGFPGNYGFLGVADVLKGDANPSGHLTDTYAVDSASSPALMNYGAMWYSNRTEEINIETATEYMFKTSYADLRAAWYLVEAEGIYTGYKYYESRYYDSVAGSLGDKAGAKSAVGASNGATTWEYPKEVSYSFGYGMSYTNFTQTINDVKVQLGSKKITANVTVKNTGTVAGKDVAQLYVQTPYTEYDKTNKVEKSAIEFVGMEKTDVLAPGASQTMDIVVDMKYMASYDAYKAKTYILDGGDYYFALGNGAHDALNNILANQGKKVSDGMDYEGKSSLTKKVRIGEIGEVDVTTFAKSDNGTVITNQLDNADLNYYLPGTVTYLSRSDWDGTYPKAYSDITIGGAKKDEWVKNLRNLTYEMKTNGTGNEVTLGASNGLKFTDLAGVPFEDERWDKLADQLTLEEIILNIAGGGNHCAVIDSVKSPKVWQTDGPNGYNGNGAPLGTKEHGNTTNPNAPYYICIEDNKDTEAVEVVDANVGYNLGTMANAPVIAATFNKELAEEFGKMVGNDSLWSGHVLLWGAGMNIHRSPYNGRNHEYYSEDTMLSNFMGTKFIIGGNKYGAIIAPKHFAFNDQETNRVGVAPYMNEQKAREGDLRAFQGAFEEGNTLGVMTTFSRIGATPFNAHTGIMQNILRKEWGFKGLVTTDMVNGEGYFRPEACFIGGITMMAQNSKTMADISGSEKGKWKYFTVDNVKKDAELVAAGKLNIKYQLYALANSNAQNSYTIKLTPSWETAIIQTINSAIIASVIWAVAYVAFVVLEKMKGKEEN